MRRNRLKNSFAANALIFSLIVAIILVLSSISVYSHGDDADEMMEHEEAEEQGFVDFSNPVFYIEVTIVWVGILSLVLLFAKDFTRHHKKMLFLLFVIPVVWATLFLAGNTIYKNTHSVTKGPVHWHADYQVWACDQRLKLVEPKGMSNRIGTSLVHEHNDDRMHVEGVIDNMSSVTLGAFFKSIGNRFEHDMIMYQTVNGMMHYHNGDQCPDGSVGSLKVYVNGKIMEEPESYLLAPEENVPPGDCIIFVFDSSSSDTTSKICESWQAKGWNYDYYHARYGYEPRNRLVGNSESMANSGGAS